MRLHEHVQSLAKIFLLFFPKWFLVSGVDEGNYGSFDMSRIIFSLFRINVNDSNRYYGNILFCSNVFIVLV